MDTTLDGHAPYGSQILAIWAEPGALGGFVAKSTIELVVWAKTKVAVTEISGDLSLLA